MNAAEIKTRYGIKYNPFLPAIPVEDIWLSPQVQLFFDRVTALVRDGGFAGIFGDPGLGKSKTAQALAWTLSRRSEDVVVGVWVTVKQSGAMPAARKSELLERIERLSSAVKFARETANGVEVTKREVGERLFTYLLG